VRWPEPFPSFPSIAGPLSGHFPSSPFFLSRFRLFSSLLLSSFSRVFECCIVRTSRVRVGFFAKLLELKIVPSLPHGPFLFFFHPSLRFLPLLTQSGAFHPPFFVLRGARGDGPSFHASDVILVFCTSSGFFFFPRNGIFWVFPLLAHLFQPYGFPILMFKPIGCHSTLSYRPSGPSAPPLANLPFFLPSFPFLPDVSPSTISSTNAVQIILNRRSASSNRSPPFRIRPPSSLPS